MLLTIKWFPRSWLQICYNGLILYIDPAYMKSYFTQCPSKIEWAVGPGEDDGLPEDLPKGDFILITHAHKDHCKSRTVKRLSHSGTAVYGPQSCLTELGPAVRIVKPGHRLEVSGIGIEVVPAYNTPSGNSTRKVHKSGSCVGYLLTLGQCRLYHAGDTDFIPEMLNLSPIDVAFLPIGGTFTMNSDEAVQAAKAMSPKWAVPIHHLNANPQEFIAILRSQAPHIIGKALSPSEMWQIGP